MRKRERLGVQISIPLVCTDSLGGSLASTTSSLSVSSSFFFFFFFFSLPSSGLSLFLETM